MRTTWSRWPAAPTRTSAESGRMSLLGRIRLFPPDEAPPPPAVPVAAGPELGDDDLEQVVGGLERIYISPACAD